MYTKFTYKALPKKNKLGESGKQIMSLLKTSISNKDWFYKDIWPDYYEDLTYDDIKNLNYLGKVILDPKNQMDDLLESFYIFEGTYGEPYLRTYSPILAFRVWYCKEEANR